MGNFLQVLILKVLPSFKHKSVKKSFDQPKKENSELINYIRDALASGATNKEIRQKLLEAGWPNNAIDDAFKKA